jgi:hypothetical protein
MDPSLAREWIDAARKLQATMEQFPQRRAADGAPQVAAHSGNVTIEVKDSLVPRLVWLAVFSAVLCAVLSIITLLGGGMLYLNMKDHLDAIYMMAPQLAKPTGEKNP